MADDFIKREDAINAVLEQLPVCFEMDAVESALMELPAADVREVVRGRWIEKGGVWECPECKAAYKARLLYIKPNFCPNCGAKMDKEG